ncbi:hypothetical protein SLEP1_g44992 [Rubroshorea leprosula]|uniref:Alcohol dehydrogenase-like N-terminal domain-containing protein n=1 Tax=Rubroshorea leprosula TaxID=152421 RepID=A0AAV5LJ24_9ROSI|nr:hypothetical protein SLEP1_g44992 [Rubroshorea leprosula]
MLMLFGLEMDLETQDILWCLVKEVGSHVRGFRVGDHVGVGTIVNSCKDCEYCNNGLEYCCSKGRISTFNGIDVDGTITKGGYSSYIVVHERFCFKIPNEYPLASAAPLLCAGITVYSPMIRHNMNVPGKSLGVIGLGGLGHMAVKFGKAFGLKITVFSTSISKKEEALNLLGANNFVISSCWSCGVQAAKVAANENESCTKWQQNEEGRAAPTAR